MGIKFIIPKPESPVEIKSVEKSVDTVEKVESKSKKEKTVKQKEPKIDKVVPLDVVPIGVQIEKGEVDKPSNQKGKGKATSNNTTSKKENWTIEKISQQVYGLHLMLNEVIPDTAITQDRADMLAESIKDVMDAYDIKVNKKVASLLGLVATVAIVEYPVMKKVKMHLLQKSSKQKATQKVVEMKKQSVEVGEPVSNQPIVAPQMIAMGVAEGEPLRA